MKEAAGGIDRAEGGDAVLPADGVVFLAVAGRGVDGAGALFERDVIGEDAERIAIEKGMAEDGAFELRAREIARRLRCSAQPQLFGGDLQQIRGDDVDIARRRRRRRTRTSD